MLAFLRFEQHLLAQGPWSMATSPALALIRAGQLLSALFTFHFRLRALQTIMPKIGHIPQAQVRLATIFRLSLLQRSIPSIALINIYYRIQGNERSLCCYC